MNDLQTAIASYHWVKENIEFAMPPRWGSVEETLRKRRGHCAMKSEVLVSRLLTAGIQARFVEGRKVHMATTLTQQLTFKLGLVIFDVHFWVEALVNREWLTLDPSPGSGIAHCIGDTVPGSHLGTPEYLLRHKELPPWYKESYNMWIFAPLRFLNDIELRLRRHR